MPITHDVLAIALAVVLALLGLALATACLAVVYLGCRLSLSTLEVTVRHQDEANAYQRKALAENLASAKSPVVLSASASPGAGEGLGAVLDAEKSRLEAELGSM